MNNKITFPRLATLLADHSGRSKRFSEDFLREFFALISETLEAQEIVKIKGFGTFRLTRVEPRRSVDVTTGEPMEISGHTKVSFIPSKELAESVNAPFEAFSPIEIGNDVDITDIFTDEEIELQDGDHDEEETVSLAKNDTGNELEHEYPIPVQDLKSDHEDQCPPEDIGNTADVTIITESASDPLEQSEEVETHIEADDPDITDETEDFDEENPRKKNWGKKLLVSFLAAVIVIFATLTIWYVFAADNFNYFIKKYNLSASIGKEATIASNPDEANAITYSATPAAVMDTAADSVLDNATEEDVPTAPSDAVVYDTISTTRYLTTMARTHYGNYNFWPYIYQENQSFLGHPDRIRPGTPVVIPKLSKYGVDPTNKADIEKAKKLGVEIYARYGKKI